MWQGGSYISRAELEVITDHSALVELFRLPNPRGRIARWILCMRPYNIKIIYRPGKKNAMADFFSRGSEESEFINNFIDA